MCVSRRQCRNGAMIERVVLAKSYDDLAAAAKTLDRILLWNNYVVPQWSFNKLRTARWDRFSHPDPLPKYGISAFPALWWWDTDKRPRPEATRLSFSTFELYQATSASL